MRIHFFFKFIQQWQKLGYEQFADCDVHRDGNIFSFSMIWLMIADLPKIENLAVRNWVQNTEGSRTMPGKLDKFVGPSWTPSIDLLIQVDTFTINPNQNSIFISCQDKSL